MTLVSMSLPQANDSMRKRAYVVVVFKRSDRRQKKGTPARSAHYPELQLLGEGSSIGKKEENEGGQTFRESDSLVQTNPLSVIVKSESCWSFGFA